MSWGTAPKLPMSGEMGPRLLMDLSFLPGFLMDLSFLLGVLGQRDSDPLELVSDFDG